ncbi:hypothetical protein [Agromyces sp. NPDC055661]
MRIAPSSDLVEEQLIRVQVPTPKRFDPNVKADGSPRVVTPPFDVALVLVHGMGNAYKSQILLEWAEPIVERLDWLTRDQSVGAVADSGQFGVTVRESDLSGPVPMVTAEIGVPSSAKESVDGVRTWKVAIIEARWSESFVPMTRRQVFRWSVAFLWRAIGRMLRQFGRTIVVIPWISWTVHRGWPHVLLRILDGLHLVLAMLVYAAVAVGVIALGIIASVLLPLLSPLLLIPWFKDKAQAIIDGIVESIGDVAVWKERPLRATAMRIVLREALDTAARLVGIDPDAEKAERERRRKDGLPEPVQDDDHPRVEVLAHSQGAAVAAYTLFSDGLVPSDYGVTHLTTVGAAVVLLGREHWKGRPDLYQPVIAWTETAPRTTWSNYWAIWDPFSAGPIADNAQALGRRWRAAYSPAPAEPATTESARAARVRARIDASFGPEEHAVHNTSQPFLDHSMYFDNTMQVVEPAARSLLPPGFPEPDDQVGYLANRLAVIDKKSLGVNMLLAIVIAGCVPGLPLVSAWLAEAFVGIGQALATVLGWIPFADTEDFNPVQSMSFLITGTNEDPQLTAWGWAVSSALLLAILIWLNQVLAGLTTRALAWSRTPRNPWRWLILSSVPRLAYTVAAAFALWYSARGDWAQNSFWLWTWYVVILVGAPLVFFQPFLARVPTAVPAYKPGTTVDPATVAPEVVAASKVAATAIAAIKSPGPGGAAASGSAGRSPLTLRGAARSDEFRREYARRRALRLQSRDVQDALDDARAATEWWGWHVRRSIRRSVRWADDWWFYPEPKRRGAQANAGAATPSVSPITDPALEREPEADPEPEPARP